MRIAVLGPMNDKNYFGGVAVFDEAICASFSKLGYEVTLYTEQCKEETVLKSVFLKKPTKKNFRKNEYDLVIASLKYIKYLKSIKAKVKIYYLHGFFNFGHYGFVRGNLGVIFQKLFLKDCDLVLCNSNFTSFINNDMYNIKTDGVVPIGVSENFLMKVSNEKDLKKAKGKITFVGRLVDVKNVDKIIESLKLVKNDFTFDIIGDGPEKEKLINLVNNSKIKDKVNFCGRLNEKEVYSHLKETDIFISLNPSEPFGIVYAEAILTNCKIVAPNTGGQNDFLKNYPLKENVNIKDIKDISRAIDCLLMKKENNINLAMDYFNYFSYDRTVQIFMDYYNKCIEGRIK